MKKNKLVVTTYKKGTKLFLSDRYWAIGNHGQIVGFYKGNKLKKLEEEI